MTDGRALRRARVVACAARALAGRLAAAMDTAPYLLLVAPPALASLAALADTARGLARLRTLGDASAVLERWPRVTIVSPACNEERHVERSVRSSLALDYPDLQVVVVDDRSTDRTGAIVDHLAGEDPRVVARHVRELPEGWLGKLNALQLGVEASDGEWLLFMDADVHLAPDALRRAIGDAERHRLDLLTVVPTIESAGPLAGGIFGLSLAILSVGGRLQKVRDPRSPAVAATGAFILVRRAALLATPGFEWLKLEVADDFGLCLLIKSNGGRCEIVNARGAVTLEWYASFREMAVAMQKNLFAILGRFSVVRSAGIAAFFAWLGLVPLAALVAAPIELRAIPLLALAALVANVALASRVTGRRRSGAALVPLACLAMSAMVVRAAWVGWRIGGIAWRGVRYPAALLAANQRVRV